MRRTDDDATCFECGLPAMHDHHVVPRSLGGTKTVPLCEEHHGMVHGRDLRTSALTSAALQAKRARGEKIGQVPYGFRATEGGKLVPSIEEQAVVALTKKLRAGGVSLRAIAASLERRGHRSRAGTPFKATQIVRMLTGRPGVSDTRDTDATATAANSQA